MKTKETHEDFHSAGISEALGPKNTQINSETPSEKHSFSAWEVVKDDKERCPRYRREDPCKEERYRGGTAESMATSFHLVEASKPYVVKVKKLFWPTPSSPKQMKLSYLNISNKKGYQTNLILIQYKK